LSSRGLEIGTFGVSAVLGCGDAGAGREAALAAVCGWHQVRDRQRLRRPDPPSATSGGRGRAGNASTAIVLQVLLDHRQAIEALEADVDDALLVLPDLPAE